MFSAVIGTSLIGGLLKGMRPENGLATARGFTRVSRLPGTGLHVRGNRCVERHPGRAFRRLHRLKSRGDSRKGVSPPSGFCPAGLVATAGFRWRRRDAPLAIEIAHARVARGRIASGRTGKLLHRLWQLVAHLRSHGHRQRRRVTGVLRARCLPLVAIVISST
jgi:hypothetical protein